MPYVLEMENASHYLPHDPAGRDYRWYVYNGARYSSFAKREVPNIVFSGSKAECEAWIAARDIVQLELTKPEARALATLASEGAEGILTDASATRGYLGDGADAAVRAIAKLDAAIAELERPGGCGAARPFAAVENVLRARDAGRAFAGREDADVATAQVIADGMPSLEAYAFLEGYLEARKATLRDAFAELERPSGCD